jgi:hypothetical protein
MIGTRECGTDVCEKCAKLDERIERYRWVLSSVNDQLTIDRIKALIEEMQNSLSPGEGRVRPPN